MGFFISTLSKETLIRECWKATQIFGIFGSNSVLVFGSPKRKAVCFLESYTTEHPTARRPLIPAVDLWVWLLLELIVILSSR